MKTPCSVCMCHMSTNIVIVMDGCVFCSFTLLLYFSLGWPRAWLVSLIATYENRNRCCNPIIQNTQCNSTLDQEKKLYLMYSHQSQIHTSTFFSVAYTSNYIRFFSVSNSFGFDILISCHATNVKRNRSISNRLSRITTGVISLHNFFFFLHFTVSADYFHSLWLTSDRFAPTSRVFENFIGTCYRLPINFKVNGWTKCKYARW